MRTSRAISRQNPRTDKKFQAYKYMTITDLTLYGPKPKKTQLALPDEEVSSRQKLLRDNIWIKEQIKQFSWLLEQL